VSVVTGGKLGDRQEGAEALARQGWLVIETGRAPTALIRTVRSRIYVLWRNGGTVDMLRAGLRLWAGDQGRPRIISSPALTDRIDVLLPIQRHADALVRLPSEG